MISLEANYSGGQLGRALANDPEELAYALKEMADCLFGMGMILAQRLPDSDDAAIIASMLRAWAEKIEPAGAV